MPGHAEGTDTGVSSANWRRNVNLQVPVSKKLLENGKFSARSAFYLREARCKVAVP
jgi:hypothetical protein